MPKVKFIGLIREHAQGDKSCTVNARTIDEMYAALEERYGKKSGQELQKAKVVVNGYAIQFLAGKKTKIQPDDDITMMILSGGG